MSSPSLKTGLFCIKGGIVIDANIMKMLTDARDSVGVVMGASQGSCWRAGKDLIITAWHVLKPHICMYISTRAVVTLNLHLKLLHSKN